MRNVWSNKIKKHWPKLKKQVTKSRMLQFVIIVGNLLQLAENPLMMIIVQDAFISFVAQNVIKSWKKIILKQTNVIIIFVGNALVFIEKNIKKK